MLLVCRGEVHRWDIISNVEWLVAAIGIIYNWLDGSHNFVVLLRYTRGAGIQWLIAPILVEHALMWWRITPHW